MIKYLYCALILIFLFRDTLLCDDDGCCSVAENDLMQDLLVVEHINKKLNDRMPFHYNNFMYGGYINMPSARMNCDGTVGFGYSYVHPYRNYNGVCQILDHLEISGNYRIFIGVDDPILSRFGFGEFSDKGANVKLALLKPEDSDYQLPGFAIGCDDFFGTRAFASKYLVLTHVFLDRSLECTLGYGIERLRGFFGGALWMPWRKSCYKYLQPITFVAEYDATDYKSPKHEHHPDGREVSCRINAGVKYRLWDAIDLSASYVRGKKFAYSISAFYNFGYTKGFLPKIDDPLPFRPGTEDYSPDTVPECLEEEKAWMKSLACIFCNQGFDLLQSWLSWDECGQRVLRLTVHNYKYHCESQVRYRLNNILAFTTPGDVDKVIVIIEAEGFPVWEYHYRTEYLHNFADSIASESELCLLTPRIAVTPRPPCSRKLYERSKPLCDYEIKPSIHTLYGSAGGKMKLAAGAVAGLYGFFKDIYYELYIGYLPFNTISTSGIDVLNPSQLINVHSDIVLYYQRRGVFLDEAFLQKNWNLGKSFYARISGGYFDCAYGGLGAEVLYAPVRQWWAVGIEGAAVRKRSLHGFSFTSKIRKLNGFEPTYVKFRGSQYFLNLYYDWTLAKIDFKVSVGKFLANDYGALFQISRYFPSGMKVSFWYTPTNAHDIINGKVYYDVGVRFSMPLDIFFTKSSRSTWGYGMSAWVRDCGFKTRAGEELYPMLDDLRKN